MLSGLNQPERIGWCDGSDGHREEKRTIRRAFAAPAPTCALTLNLCPKAQRPPTEEGERGREYFREVQKVVFALF